MEESNAELCDNGVDSVALWKRHVRLPFDYHAGDESKDVSIRFEDYERTHLRFTDPSNVDRQHHS